MSELVQISLREMLIQKQELSIYKRVHSELTKAEEAPFLTCCYVVTNALQHISKRASPLLIGSTSLCPSRSPAAACSACPLHWCLGGS